MNIQTITLNNSYLFDNLLISSFKIIPYKILEEKWKKKKEKDIRKIENTANNNHAH